jgi:hypothetical protein
MEETLQATTELFGSPLNYSMAAGITYCSTFLEDDVFGAVINAFLFRWTISCIANSEYDPEDMLKVILLAIASSECTEIPLSVILTLPVWEDTPWNSVSIRGHGDMTTLA